MALSWAQSKVERFQENAVGSSLGPGDYNPCVPKSHGMAGAVSLGFTSTKGLQQVERAVESIPEETTAILNAARDRTSVASASGTTASSRRSSFGGPRTSLDAGGGGMSRLERVKSEQQAKQLAWAEMEREKLQSEVKTLRSLQVCTALLSVSHISSCEVCARLHASCIIQQQYSRYHHDTTSVVYSSTLDQYVTA